MFPIKDVAESYAVQNRGMTTSSGCFETNTKVEVHMKSQIDGKEVDM